MEREILKRDFVVESNKIFKYLSYVLFAIAGASLIAYFIIVAVDGYWEQMFDFEDDYLHIFLIALGFLILAVIFFLRKGESNTTSVILTDKRIYSLTKSGTVIKSYNLCKINAYAFCEFKQGGLLKISTSSLNAVFSVDKEFYNAFVDAINANL